MAAIEAADYEEAEWLLMQIGDEDKETYQTALFYRSRIYCTLEDHERAQGMLERAIRAHPAAYLYYYLGACLQHREQWAKSEPHLRRAVELDPRQTDAFILLGKACQHLDRTDEAVVCFERALANDPRAKLARFLLAQICITRRDHTRALALLHVLQGQEPDYPPTHRLQAEIHLALGDRRQALVELCWLVDNGHADLWCYTAMGYSFEAISEKEQALVAFERTLCLEPDLPGVMAAAAKLCEELERFASALAFYRALEAEADWTDRARAAADRLERKVAFCRMMGKPEDRAFAFEGFKAPDVAERSRTAPIAFRAGSQRTAPIAARSRTASAFQPNEGNGQAPAAPAQPSPEVAYAWAAQAQAARPPDEPLAMRLARNVASITREVAADPSSLLAKGKDSLIDSAIDFLGKLKGNRP
ncbi:MAG: tetratricopeptide repeat protein [Candidatus Sericytochromatia bacterium]|nr:tetratricopeptide repeat protein [Candidatus Tanganyikabacteria bacterium]